jgi:hypothetical protein
MAFSQGAKLRKGLDDGVRLTKKQKKAADNGKPSHAETYKSPFAKAEMPKIPAGERMSEFSARVDAAIPISGLMNRAGKGGKDPLGLKVGRTKKEKKMHKMYDEWREQDKKIKEKREEELEKAQEEEEDEDGGKVKWKVDMEAEERSHGKKKGKGKKGKVIGEVDDGDADPWAAVARARNEGPRKLNDVVQEPPQFTKLPKEKFKVRGARVEVEDVPKASGSLRQRELLGETRRSVIEGYRQMMAENRAASREQA